MEGISLDALIHVRRRIRAHPGLGGDGYLGWPTALHLSGVGHNVAVADNFARRGYDRELGATSLVPIAPLERRITVWHPVSGRKIEAFIGDLTDPAFTRSMVENFHPETIVHFAEQRSAPYSMIDQAHAVYTQANNVTGTLNVLYAIAEIDPAIHLVKLGTMGEYGTPNIDIEEGSSRSPTTVAPIRSCTPSGRAPSTTSPRSLNRPGFPGGSKPWKGWSHGRTETIIEAVSA